MRLLTTAARLLAASLSAQDKAVVVTCRVGEGDPLEVKGFSWHADERHLAITAGPYLFLHDVQEGTTTQVARFGVDDVPTFVADPRWIGDRVLLTEIEDLTGGR